MALFNLSDIDISDGGDGQPVQTVIAGEYRYVMYKTGKALVFKGENKEPSYEVTPMGCTCPGDRYSSNPCKHRKAISYLGDGSAVPPVEGTTVKTKDFVNNTQEEKSSGILYNIDDLLA